MEALDVGGWHLGISITSILLRLVFSLSHSLSLWHLGTQGIQHGLYEDDEDKYELDDF